MRIPSGSSDRYHYFVAVDATDRVSYETGLATWTVYRSRNGAAEAAMTTPTITEIDAVNCPGLYALLMDEDTTLDAGHDTEEIAFRITHSGMAPVTLTAELYRPETTEGQTLTVASGQGDVDVKQWNGTNVPSEHTAGYPIVTIKDGTGTGEIDTSSGTVTLTDASLTAAKIGSDAITAAKVHADVSQEIADTVLTRPIDTAEASATAKCLTWLLAMVLNVKTLSGGTVTVKKTDGSTTLFTQAVTQTPGEDPVTATAEAS